MKVPAYIPGVCNIGKGEVRQRLAVGWACLAVTLLMFWLLRYSTLSPAWNLLIALPAAASALGFLQGFLHFCAAFGLAGMYNVLTSAGTTESVDNAVYRAQDRSKAVRIIVYSVLIGIGVSLLSYL